MNDIVTILIEEFNEVVNITSEESIESSNITIEESNQEVTLLIEESTSNLNIEISEITETVSIKVEDVGIKGDNGATTSSLISYRSDYDNLYIYSGFVLDGVHIIKRTKDNSEEFAENVVDLEIDWLDRLNLIYS